MKTTIYRYSLWAGALLVTFGLINWFLISRPLGYQVSEIVGYLSMVLAMTMVFFAIKHFRDQQNAGKVSFKQGFRIGILITLITAALFFVYTAVFFVLQGDTFKEWSTESFSTRMTAEELQEYQAMLANPLFNNPAFQGLVMFVTVFLIGMIITLISATVLKKD